MVTKPENTTVFMIRDRSLISNVQNLIGLLVLLPNKQGLIDG